MINTNEIEVKITGWEISAEIICDSVNSATGNRLTTFVIYIPRFLLPQLNTHRSLSKNCSSSRAIPCKKFRKQILENPFIPIKFGKGGKGMQAHGELSPTKIWLAKQAWLFARYPVVCVHWFLSDVLGLSKEVSNRLLEPWMWAEVLITGTEWKNFFTLRCHKDAQPEFQAVANLMYTAYISHIPETLEPGEYHLPFVTEAEKEDYEIEALLKISSARCARVSYLLPEGGFSTVGRDLELFDRLNSYPLHASAFEHDAIALPVRKREANLVGWRSYRRNFVNEANGDYEGC